jgi:hypothetical protein
MRGRFLLLVPMAVLLLVEPLHGPEALQEAFFEARVRLLDAFTRRPLEGRVSIEVWPKWEAKEIPAGYGSAETDEDGTFVIDDLPYGPASVVGMAKDHGREFLATFIEPHMPELEVLLPIGACVEGLRDPMEVPIPETSPGPAPSHDPS